MNIAKKNYFLYKPNVECFNDLETRVSMMNTLVAFFNQEQIRYGQAFRSPTKICIYLNKKILHVAPNSGTDFSLRVYDFLQTCFDDSTDEDVLTYYLDFLKKIDTLCVNKMDYFLILTTSSKMNCVPAALKTFCFFEKTIHNTKMWAFIHNDDNISSGGLDEPVRSRREHVNVRDKSPHAIKPFQYDALFPYIDNVVLIYTRRQYEGSDKASITGIQYQYKTMPILIDNRTNTNIMCDLIVQNNLTHDVSAPKRSRSTTNSANCLLSAINTTPPIIIKQQTPKNTVGDFADSEGHEQRQVLRPPSCSTTTHIRFPFDEYYAASILLTRNMCEDMYKEKNMHVGRHALEFDRAVTLIDFLLTEPKSTPAPPLVVNCEKWKHDFVVFNNRRDAMPWFFYEGKTLPILYDRLFSKKIALYNISVYFRVDMDSPITGCIVFLICGWFYYLSNSVALIERHGGNYYARDNTYFTALILLFERELAYGKKLILAGNQDFLNLFDRILKNACTTRQTTMFTLKNVCEWILEYEEGHVSLNCFFNRMFETQWLRMTTFTWLDDTVGRMIGYLDYQKASTTSTTTTSTTTMTTSLTIFDNIFQKLVEYDDCFDAEIVARKNLLEYEGYHVLVNSDKPLFMVVNGPDDLFAHFDRRVWWTHLFKKDLLAGKSIMSGLNLIELLAGFKYDVAEEYLIETIVSRAEFFSRLYSVSCSFTFIDKSEQQQPLDGFLRDVLQKLGSVPCSRTAHTTGISRQEHYDDVHELLEPAKNTLVCFEKNDSRAQFAFITTTSTKSTVVDKFTVVFLTPDDEKIFNDNHVDCNINEKYLFCVGRKINSVKKMSNPGEIPTGSSRRDRTDGDEMVSLDGVVNSELCCFTNWTTLTVINSGFCFVNIFKQTCDYAALTRLFSMGFRLKTDLACCMVELKEQFAIECFLYRVETIFKNKPRAPCLPLVELIVSDDCAGGRCTRTSIVPCTTACDNDAPNFYYKNCLKFLDFICH